MNNAICCKGSMYLGNGCGACEQCREDAPGAAKQHLQELRELRAATEWRHVDDELPTLRQTVIVAGWTEEQKYKTTKAWRTDMGGGAWVWECPQDEWNWKCAEYWRPIPEPPPSRHAAPEAAT